ncbi:MAG: hypothetical protein ACR65O_12880 [Methylomicrobium sp.]
MPVDIMLTVAFTAIIQSVFGAGVLLFGTPLLLLFGHEFVDVLVVLLPISIGINLLQIVKHHTQIDFAFYRNILTLNPAADRGVPVPGDPCADQRRPADRRLFAVHRL